jgi:hypothetical protein
VTARLNLAYQIVTDDVTRSAGGDVYDASGDVFDPDPFGDPKGVADRIFVNELRCVHPSNQGMTFAAMQKLRIGNVRVWHGATETGQILNEGLQVCGARLFLVLR